MNATTPTRQATLPASIERGTTLNAKFGLKLKDDALAIVTSDVEGITDGATLHPVTNPDLIANVQEIVVADRWTALHLSLDLHAGNAAKYLAQGASKNAFLFVMVNEALGTARQVNVKLSPQYAREKSRATKFFSSFKADGSQAEAYVYAVGRAGYLSLDAACEAVGDGYRPTLLHFRPVLSAEHQPFLENLSLDELVAMGDRVGSIGQMLGMQLMGSGSKEDMLALASLLQQGKH